jgi:hypothetical protein
MDVRRLILVAACAASAGAHAGLIPDHLAHEPALGASFVAATVVTLFAAGWLTARPSSTTAAYLAALVLAALIVAYALNVTVGIPWLTHSPEPVDAAGLATKAVEALGLVFALLHLIPTTSGRGSLEHKEART